MFMNYVAKSGRARGNNGGSSNGDSSNNGASNSGNDSHSNSNSNSDSNTSPPTPAQNPAQSPYFSSVQSSHSNFALEHYVRPRDIQVCLNMHSDKTAAQCACKLSGVGDNSKVFLDQCYEGYKAGGALGKSVGDSMRWCLNNNPYQDSSSLDQYDSWMTGCLNGITGPKMSS